MITKGNIIVTIEYLPRRCVFVHVCLCVYVCDVVDVQIKYRVSLSLEAPNYCL